MPRIPTMLSVVLGVAAAGLGLYAWQLQAQIADARVDSQRLAADVERLQALLSEAQKAQAAAAAEANSARNRPGPADDSAAPQAESGPGPQRWNRREALAQSPEFQKIRQLERREFLDQRFAALFRKLNLPPAQLERLKDLLVERELAAGDVFEAARSAGINLRDSRDLMQKQIADAESAVDATIRSELGDGVLQQFQQYEQSGPQRAIVSQLERRLSYSDSPLTPAQSDQLVAMLSAAAGGSTGSAGNDPGAFGFGGGGRGLASVTDNVLAQARTVLSDPQVQTLTALRDQAAQRAALRQQLRAQLQSAGVVPPKTGRGP